ncbi:hypothetical protein RhiJN_27244 [Ceratobasidium sp. AG-Ba]|nr:hypothetical protein RhiJN_27244 [Ceratobasidium sp. AG-Ba]QRW13723.1 hypothetical protein RhiLY_12722 [Ceratobasidium sp. AG-Ba]
MPVTFSSVHDTGDIGESCDGPVESRADEDNCSEDEVDERIELVEQTEISPSGSTKSSSVGLGSHPRHYDTEGVAVVLTSESVISISDSSDGVPDDLSMGSVDSYGSSQESSSVASVESSSGVEASSLDDTEMSGNDEEAGSPLEEGEIECNDLIGGSADEMVDMSISEGSLAGNSGNNTPVQHGGDCLGLGFQTPARATIPATPRLPATFPASRMRSRLLFAEDFISPSIRYQPYLRPIPQPGDWQ